MKILMLDNYDSFTFNLVHLLKEIGVDQLDVFRNDHISLNDVGSYDSIVLSPGPGLPIEAGIMPDLVKRYATTKKILGVCLGHQCICEVFGATLTNMKNVCHGKGLPTRIIDDKETLFQKIPKQFNTGRYHSWIVDQKNLPQNIKVTAIDDENRIMAIRCKETRVSGVQFHPESVLTEYGRSIMENWLNE